MFDTFDSAADGQSAGRYAVSATTSIVVLALIAAGAVAMANRVQQVLKEKRTEVVFRPPPVAAKPPPPPPPPPKPKPKPKAEPPAPPTVAAPAALVAPKEVPQEKPPETDAANAVEAAPMAVGGTGKLVPGAVVTGVDSAGVPEAPPKRGPINLPEEAEPPEPLESNANPEYPAEARTQGLEGMVIIKIVVEEDGSTRIVKVMRGDEPFVTAAVEAVKTWRFKPALVDGQPTAVFRILKIPFRIRQ